MSNRDDAEFKIDDPAEQRVRKLPPLDRHPGLFVKEVLMPEYGLDVSKLARHLSVNRSNLWEVLNGKRDVSRDLAYRLGAAMGDEAADLVIAYQNAWDVEQERDRRASFKENIARLAPKG